MIKPILNKINTFDPALNYVFSFTYNGNQSMSNRLVITDNDTNGIIYDKTVVSMKLQQTLPANTLQSNKQYSAQFQSIDANGNASPLSDKAYFYCLKAPVFEFTNVTNVIENSSYEFILNYSQSESENLKEYKITLYDSKTSTAIRDSGVIYPAKGISEITYNISALEDDVKYYIQATGTTVHGMEIKTEKYEFYVSYIRPSQYAAFYTENDADNGCIKFSTNIIVISYNGDEVFKYNNGYVDVIDKTLYYDAGFNIDEDFVLKLAGTYLRCGEFFKMSNDNHSVTLDIIRDENNELRIMLTANNSLSSYKMFSDPFTYTGRDNVLITFYRKDGYYGIQTEVVYGNMVFTDMYIGNTRPTEITGSGVYIYDSIVPTVKINAENMNITFDSVAPSNPQGYDIWIRQKGEV